MPEYDGPSELTAPGVRRIWGCPVVLRSMALHAVSSAGPALSLAVPTPCASGAGHPQRVESTRHRSRRRIAGRAGAVSAARPQTPSRSRGSARTRGRSRAVRPQPRSPECSMRPGSTGAKDRDRSSGPLPAKYAGASTQRRDRAARDRDARRRACTMMHHDVQSPVIASARTGTKRSGAPKGPALSYWVILRRSPSYSVVFRRTPS